MSARRCARSACSVPLASARYIGRRAPARESRDESLGHVELETAIEAHARHERGLGVDEPSLRTVEVEAVALGVRAELGLGREPNLSVAIDGFREPAERQAA